MWSGFRQLDTCPKYHPCACRNNELVVGRIMHRPYTDLIRTTAPTHQSYSMISYPHGLIVFLYACAGNGIKRGACNHGPLVRGVSTRLWSTQSSLRPCFSIADSLETADRIIGMAETRSINTNIRWIETSLQFCVKYAFSSGSRFLVVYLFTRHVWRTPSVQDIVCLGEYLWSIRVGTP